MLATFGSVQSRPIYTGGQLLETRELVLTTDIFGRVGKQAHNPKPNDKENTFFLILCSKLKHGIACRPSVKVAKKLYAFYIF